MLALILVLLPAVLCQNVVYQQQPGVTTYPAQVEYVYQQPQVYPGNGVITLPAGTQYVQGGQAYTFNTVPNQQIYTNPGTTGQYTFNTVPSQQVVTASNAGGQYVVRPGTGTTVGTTTGTNAYNTNYQAIMNQMNGGRTTTTGTVVQQPRQTVVQMPAQTAPTRTVYVMQDPAIMEQQRQQIIFEFLMQQQLQQQQQPQQNQQIQQNQQNQRCQNVNKSTHAPSNPNKQTVTAQKAENAVRTYHQVGPSDLNQVISTLRDAKARFEREINDAAAEAKRQIQQHEQDGNRRAQLESQVERHRVDAIRNIDAEMNNKNLTPEQRLNGAAAAATHGVDQMANEMRSGNVPPATVQQIRDHYHRNINTTRDTHKSTVQARERNAATEYQQAENRVRENMDEIRRSVDENNKRFGDTLRQGLNGMSPMSQQEVNRIIDKKNREVETALNDSTSPAEAFSRIERANDQMYSEIEFVMINKRGEYCLTDLDLQRIMGFMQSNESGINSANNEAKRETQNVIKSAEDLDMNLQEVYRAFTRRR